MQQGTDFAASAFVSVNGQYLIDLPPGSYMVYVACLTAQAKLPRGKCKEELTKSSTLHTDQINKLKGTGQET